MRTRLAHALGLSAALLSPAFVSSAHAQVPANVGQQVGGQVLNNVGNAALGQPAGAVPGQPGGYGTPATPGQQTGGQILNNVGNAALGQPAGAMPGQPGGYGTPATPGQALQGMERQAISNVTGAVTGQPGTTPGQAAWGPRYQLPGQFGGNAPGTTVTYGGTNYIVNADGTMSPAAAGAQPAANAARYQLPAQYSGTAPGSTVNYGGTSYTVNADRTMSPASAMAPGQPDAYGRPAAPVMERRSMYNAPGAVGNPPVYASPQTTSAVRYQLPGQFGGHAPGTTVTYGGANYVINNNGTMSPIAR